MRAESRSNIQMILVQMIVSEMMKAGNPVRDVAALNNMEMLPWDVWSAMSGADAALKDDQLYLFDKLAAPHMLPTPSSARSIKATTACFCPLSRVQCRPESP
jgi:hypothetical protein